MPKTAKVVPLLDEHHVSRFVPYRRQYRDFDTDALLGVFTTAFDLRPQDKGALSVTWVEYFGAKSSTTMKAAATAFKKCTKSRKLTATAVFAIASVASIKAASKSTGKPARVLHEATNCNPAHATVRRLDNNQIEVLDAVAQQAFGELVDADGGFLCASPVMGITPV